MVELELCTLVVVHIVVHSGSWKVVYSGSCILVVHSGSWKFVYSGSVVV